MEICITYGYSGNSNGHIGTDHFVHYREVVLFQRYCHYIGSCIGKCPLSEVPLYMFSCTCADVVLVIGTPGQAGTRAVMGGDIDNRMDNVTPSI